MSFNILPHSLIALILKYANYSIIRGKIVRDNSFLEDMVRRQLQNDNICYNQCTSRLLMENKSLHVAIIHHWKKDIYIYSIYIYNKATKRESILLCRKIDDKLVVSERETFY
jgi:hypothetical protein